MNDDSTLDLGPLDPSRDVERWKARVACVAALASAAHEERSSFSSQLRFFARPALALAAAVAVLAWVPWPRQPHAARTTRASGLLPVTSFEAWAIGGTVEPWDALSSVERSP
jgi:hypothetical protein